MITKEQVEFKLYVKKGFGTAKANTLVPVIIPPIGGELEMRMDVLYQNAEQFEQSLITQAKDYLCRFIRMHGKMPSDNTWQRYSPFSKGTIAPFGYESRILEFEFVGLKYGVLLNGDFPTDPSLIEHVINSGVQQFLRLNYDTEVFTAVSKPNQSEDYESFMDTLVKGTAHTSCIATLSYHAPAFQKVNGVKVPTNRLMYDMEHDCYLAVGPFTTDQPTPSLIIYANKSDIVRVKKAYDTCNA